MKLQPAIDEFLHYIEIEKTVRRIRIAVMGLIGMNPTVMDRPWNLWDRIHTYEGGTNYYRQLFPETVQIMNLIGHTHPNLLGYLTFYLIT